MDHRAVVIDVTRHRSYRGTRKSPPDQEVAAIAGVHHAVLKINAGTLLAIDPIHPALAGGCKQGRGRNVVGSNPGLYAAEGEKNRG
jgi:hypothetical protein